MWRCQVACHGELNNCRRYSGDPGCASLVLQDSVPPLDKQDRFLTAKCELCRSIFVGSCLGAAHEGNSWFGAGAFIDSRRVDGRVWT